MTYIVKKSYKGKSFFLLKSNSRKNCKIIVMRTKPAAIGARSNTPGSLDEAVAHYEVTFCTAYYN